MTKKELITEIASRIHSEEKLKELYDYMLETEEGFKEFTNKTKGMTAQEVCSCYGLDYNNPFANFI